MYKLHWNKDTAAMAPQLVLEEGGLSYETITVDIQSGGNWTPEYLAINPAGYIPALVREDGSILTESAAICLYLCDHHGLSELLPAAADPDRGLVLSRLFFLTSSLQAVYKRYYYPHRFSTDEADRPRIREKAREDLVGNWKLVDNHLAANGPLHLGQRVSVADHFMVMLATWFPSGWRDLAEHCPALGHAFELTAERPAVSRVLAQHDAYEE